MPTLRAFIEGYQEHLFDLKCLTVYQGYWAGYYSNSKRPKPLSAILNKILSEHKKLNRRKNKIFKPEVDLDTFMERERRFQTFLRRSDTNG